MHYKRWTPEEDKFLSVCNEHFSNKELAEKLDRTIPSVKNRKIELGLTRTQRNLNQYELVRGYEVLFTGSVYECAAYLKVKVSSIYYYASPTYHKRIKNLDKAVVAFKLENDLEMSI